MDCPCGLPGHHPVSPPPRSHELLSGKWNHLSCTLHALYYLGLCYNRDAKYCLKLITLYSKRHLNSYTEPFNTD